MGKSDLIFLISAPYSGATLLSILMNQHPGVSSDGEIFPYEIRGENVVCSCGKNQIECNYYRTVASCMMKADKKAFDGSLFYYVPQYSRSYYLSRALEGFWMSSFANKFRKVICSNIPKYRRLERDFINLQIEFFRKSLDARKATVYFDGTKSVRRAEFFAERKLTSRMIHLIRDGRAFCNSFIKNKGLTKNNLSDAANVWKKSIRKVDKLRKRFPNIEILDVRYNDLCADPKAELSRIFDFLKLSFDDSFLVYRREDMHIIGNRMRFNYSGTITEDDSWKKNLRQEDFRLINKLMENELKRFDFISDPVRNDIDYV